MFLRLFGPSAGSGILQVPAAGLTRLEDVIDGTFTGEPGPTGPEGPAGPPGPTTWAGITDKPTTFPPVIGSGAGDAVAGNDSRLTDARTPTAHAASHQNGGSDEIGVAGLSGELADPQPSTPAKIAFAATDKLLGRATVGAGPGEEISLTAAGRALLDDADATAQRATLGLGTAATAATTDFATAGHNHAGVYEPADTAIQTHITSAHAPSDAQKNSDITKAEIEAKLIGVISSHSHVGGDGGPVFGTGTLNFGSRTTAKKYSQVDVTGLSGLSASSHLGVFMQGDVTADHSTDEHVVEIIHLRMVYLTATTARVIAQVDRGKAWGDFTFHYQVSV